MVQFWSPWLFRWYQLKFWTYQNWYFWSNHKGQNCVKIVSKLCQNCVKIVSKLCQNCVKTDPWIVVIIVKVGIYFWNKKYILLTLCLIFTLYSLFQFLLIFNINFLTYYNNCFWILSNCELIMTCQNLSLEIRNDTE